MYPRLRASVWWRAAWACVALLCAGAGAGAGTAGAGPSSLDQLPQDWRDDLGQPLALTNLIGHRVVLSMAYSRCHHTCPATFNELQRMQKTLDGRGEQASFVIVGYDADNDDPRSWHQYRLNHGFGRANWYFLTGTPQAVRRLARELGFEFWNYDTHVMHDSRVVFFDSKGLYSGAVSPATSDWTALLCSDSTETSPCHARH
ncbi:MAG: SCO family protein [Steroidobacteraceae bacterium]